MSKEVLSVISVFVGSLDKKLISQTSKYVLALAVVPKILSFFGLNISDVLSFWKCLHKHIFLVCFMISTMIPTYSLVSSVSFSSESGKILSNSLVAYGELRFLKSSRGNVSSLNPKSTVLGFIAPIPLILTS
uniref:Uncharacterized protein n=1 Tax=Lepeophtheirus salmonis TaxID=72036 RepID=A0A0K2TF23_LEPSM